MKPVLALLLLISFVYSGSAQDVYNKARANLSAGDTTSAVTAFADAVKAGQKLTESHYYLGLINFRRGKLDDALTHLLASVKADDENVEALTLAGDVLLAKNDARSALKEYRAAAKLEPKNPSIARGMGVALLGLDSIDAAIVFLTRAKEYAPDNPAIFEALGDAYVKQNVVVLGITNYKKAVELDSSNILYHYKLAQAFEKDRKYNDAVKEYESVLQINRDYADAYFQEGSILFRAKLYRNAVQPLREYVKLRPKDFEAQLMYAKTLYEVKAYDEAVKACSDALALDSSGVDIWRTYFYALLDARDVERANGAVKSLERRGKLIPDDYIKLGELEFQLKHYDEALKWYQEAVKADSASCDPYFNLGFIYMNKRDYEQAALMFEKKIACEPRSLSAYINGGASYMQVKNFERARELFLTAIDLKGDFYQGRLWLARTYTQMDSLTEAVAQYDSVLNLIGDPPPSDKRKDAAEAHYLRGTVYFIKQLYPKAVDEYRRSIVLGYETDALFLSYGQGLLLTLDPQGDKADNRKKVEDAVKAFRKCVALNDKNAQGHLWLAQGLVQSRIDGDPNGDNKQLTAEACGEAGKALKLDSRLDEAKKLSVRIGCK